MSIAELGAPSQTDRSTDSDAPQTAASRIMLLEA
jgi:hypothetical protein